MAQDSGLTSALQEAMLEVQRQDAQIYANTGRHMTQEQMQIVLRSALQSARQASVENRRNEMENERANARLKMEKDQIKKGDQAAQLKGIFDVGKTAYDIYDSRFSANAKAQNALGNELQRAYIDYMRGNTPAKLGEGQQIPDTSKADMGQQTNVGYNQGFDDKGNPNIKLTDRVPLRATDNLPSGAMYGGNLVFNNAPNDAVLDMLGLGYLNPPTTLATPQTNIPLAPASTDAGLGNVQNTAPQAVNSWQGRGQDALSGIGKNYLGAVIEGYKGYSDIPAREAALENSPRLRGMLGMGKPSEVGNWGRNIQRGVQVGGSAVQGLYSSQPSQLMQADYYAGQGKVLPTVGAYTSYMDPAGSVGTAQKVAGLFGDTSLDQKKTVICTALHSHGLISDDIYKLDAEYGKKQSEAVLQGYRFIATPLAEKMKKSKKLAKFIKIFANSAIKEMAHQVDPKIKGSLIGKAILAIGKPICRLRYEMNYFKGESVEV